MTEPRMTYEHRKTLSGLLLEYGNSLTRIAGERDLMKAMEERGLLECGIDPKSFRVVAIAMWKDRVDQTLEDLTEKCDLIELIRAEEETPHA